MTKEEILARKAVLTLVNNTPYRLAVTVYLPQKYCPADGCLTGKLVEKDSPIIKLEGEGLWWLNTIKRSEAGIKVSIEGVIEVCEHEWLSADNEVIKGAEICVKCLMIREVEPLNM